MAELKASPSGQYVRYIGTADVREISKKDWKNVDLDHPTVTWSRENNFLVPVEDISEDAWQYIEEDEALVLLKKESLEEAVKTVKRHPAFTTQTPTSEDTAAEAAVGRDAPRGGKAQPGGRGESGGSATPSGGAVGGSTSGTGTGTT